MVKLRRNLGNVFSKNVNKLAFRRGVDCDGALTLLRQSEVALTVYSGCGMGSGTPGVS